ncbi:MAG: response regulator [Thermodesulfobacteriota bacterium]
MARVLVIDDEEGIREMLQRHLKRRGHEVSTAPDGVTGLELFRNQPADVVVIDILMPGELGTTTILHLVSEFPDTQIIAISGGGQLPAEHGLDIARQVGARRTFPKPLDIRGLLEAVDYLANTRSRAIETVLDEYFKTMRTRDFESLLRSAILDPDAVMIDPVAEKIAEGAESLRRLLATETDFTVKPVEYSVIALKAIGPVTIFAARCVIRILGKEDLAISDLPARWTGVIENRDGASVLIQSHLSVSFSTAVKAVDRRPRT